MLRMMNEEDRDGIFGVPVVEAFPDLEEAYLAEIENPIDLRTIEEERVPQYERIAQLQEDLLLMLDNCIQFNSPEDSELSQYAM